MIAMPPRLTITCAASDPKLSVSAMWPIKDRNTAMQNTASDCSPHLISGSNTGHFSHCASLATKRVTMNTTTTKCSSRYGARLTLPSGSKLSSSDGGNRSPSAGKRRAIMMTSANIR